MNQQVCDTDRLNAFVHGELDADAERDLTLHLDECETCGQTLESKVAEASAWREASDLLGGGDAFDSGDGRRDREEQRNAQINQVLAQLTPTDDPDSLGRIGGYEVTGVIGSGGMGVVLKAHDRPLDRVVAVKLMAPHLAASGSARQRFAREAKAAAAVLHPNVIAIHGVSNDLSLPFLVMPYVPGSSLQKRVDGEGPLPILDILRIGSQVAAGLAAAHEQGLVHRDIKPANILLEQGVERVTITDFGLARAVDDASMTRSGVIAGTPQYMSPEQARGEAIDHRSDLFSLGSLLYALCTGHSPFRAETSFGVLHRITHDSPRPIRELNPSVPEWLEGIVMKLLSKSRDDRFDSAEQVAELLEDCLAHVQDPTTTPLPQRAATSPFLGRRPPCGKFIAAAAFAFSLIFAGVLIVLELNKGTLTIESDVDDVPIRIMQGDEVVKKLTVTKDTESVRIAAGNYLVEIDGKFDGIVVDKGFVSLKRRGNETVKLRMQPTTDHAKKASAASNDGDDVAQVEGNRTFSRPGMGVESALNTFDSATDLQREIRQVLSTIDDFNRREDAGPNSPRSPRWGLELMKLVSYGSDAVPSIVRQLDRTRDDRMIATLAFALRAIKDKRGVPALIRAIPSTSVPHTKCNWIRSSSRSKKELVDFFQEHKFAGQGNASMGGCSDSPTELTHALHELTGQKFGFSRTFGIGMPLQIYLQQKTLLQDAQRWSDWWDANSGSMVDDAAYKSVNLPLMSLDQPDPLDPNQVFAKAFWSTGRQLQALQIAEDSTEQARPSFLDLDTGRTMPVPDKWRGKQLTVADRSNLFSWAEDEGFDLVCDRFEMDDGSSHHALRGIGANAWQIDERRWKEQSEYASLAELTSEGKKVVGDWLLPRSKETGELEPTAVAPFLIVTREGSPILVYVGAEITELASPDRTFPIDDLLRPSGFLIGRKLEIQPFESLGFEKVTETVDSVRVPDPMMGAEKEPKASVRDQVQKLTLEEDRQTKAVKSNEAKEDHPPTKDAGKRSTIPVGAIPFGGEVWSYLSVPDSKPFAPGMWNATAIKHLKDAKIHLCKVTIPHGVNDAKDVERIKTFTSNDSGRFDGFIPAKHAELLDRDPSEPYLTLVVEADGYVSESRASLAENWTNQMKFALVPDDQPIKGTILRSDGRPAEDVRVTVVEVERSKPEPLNVWLEKASSERQAWNVSRYAFGSSFYRELDFLLTNRFDTLQNAVTDDKGSFELRGSSPNDVLMLEIEGKGIPKSYLRVVGREIGRVYLPYESGECGIYYGSTFQYTYGKDQESVASVNEGFAEPSGPKLMSDTTEGSDSVADKKSHNDATPRVNFAEMSEIRTRLKTADSRVNQSIASVERWKQRVALHKLHPSGRVNGKDIPNSNSVEDAQESLESAKLQVLQLKRDREFLHREVTARYAILRKQADVAFAVRELAHSKANAYQKLRKEGTTTQYEANSVRVDSLKAEAESTKLKELLEQFNAIVKEFAIDVPSQGNPSSSSQVTPSLEDRLAATKVADQNTKDKFATDAPTPTLETAVEQFNQHSASFRRRFFNPPIPELTVEELRSALLKRADLFVVSPELVGDREKKIADLLRAFAKNGDADEGYRMTLTCRFNNFIFDHSGTNNSRRLVPVLAIERVDSPWYTDFELDSLELFSHETTGPSSKHYGDPDLQDYSDKSLRLTVERRATENVTKAVPLETETNQSASGFKTQKSEGLN